MQLRIDNIIAMEPLITIVIPTRNRSSMLRGCIESVLGQTERVIKVIILDNHSVDDTERVVAEFGDERIVYVKHDQDIGIIGNWNYALQICTTKYLCIFHDDDVMLPDFVKRQLSAIEENLNVGFSYCYADKVDKDMNYFSRWSEHIPGIGVVPGARYIEYTIERGCCVTIAPTVVMRMSAISQTGPFRDELCMNSFDFNMWLRIAEKFAVYFIDETLVKYRIHEGQMSEEYWRHNKAKGRLATMLELQRVALVLLARSQSSGDSHMHSFILKKMDEYNRLSAQYARELVPGL